jgi:hypothetical protein
MMNADVVTTIRSIRRLADSADQIACSIEQHRVRRDHGGPVAVVSVEQPHRTNTYHAANGASVMAVSHLGQLCRDLHSTYVTAFAALPPDLQKAIAAN